MSRILVGQKILFNLIGPYFETVFKNPPGALFKILRTIASCFFEIHPRGARGLHACNPFDWLSFETANILLAHI